MVPSDEVTDTGNEGWSEESESVKINFGKMPNTWMKPANAQSTIVGEFSQLSNKRIHIILSKNVTLHLVPKRLPVNNHKKLFLFQAFIKLRFQHMLQHIIEQFYVVATPEKIGMRRMKE